VLTQDSFTVDFETLSSAGMEGIVQAACPDLDQVVVSADDLRQLGSDLTLAIPKDVDVADLEPGDSVTAVGNAGGTGTLSAAKGSVSALEQSITTAAEGAPAPVASTENAQA